MYIVYRIMSEIHGLTEFLKVKTVGLSVHITLMNALKQPGVLLQCLECCLLQTPPHPTSPPLSTAMKGFLAGKYNVLKSLCIFFIHNNINYKTKISVWLGIMRWRTPPTFPAFP